MCAAHERRRVVREPRPSTRPAPEWVASRDLRARQLHAISDRFSQALRERHEVVACFVSRAGAIAFWPGGNAHRSDQLLDVKSAWRRRQVRSSGVLKSALAALSAAPAGIIRASSGRMLVRSGLPESGGQALFRNKLPASTRARVPFPPEAVRDVCARITRRAYRSDRTRHPVPV